MPYSICSSGKFYLNSFKNNYRPVCIDAVVLKGAFYFYLSLHIREVARRSGICELENLGRLPELTLELQELIAIAGLPRACPGRSLHLSSHLTQAAGAEPASQLFWTTPVPPSSLSVPCPGQQALSSGGSCKQSLSIRTAVSKAC